MKGTVISLCDRTGNMVRPWAEEGYVCYCLDIQHPHPGNREEVGNGVVYKTHFNVLGKLNLALPPAIVFAFPPCTHLAVSGARWFQAKGMDALIEALTVVNACRRICESSGAPWMLENPVSTLATYWRKADYVFDPCDYAGYLDTDEDAYTKKTCLWAGGGFVMPPTRRVTPVYGSKMHRMGPSVDRAEKRSETPRGFARAVFEANHGRSL